MAIGPAPAAEVAPAPAPVRRLNVWLVHGTWARGIFAAAPNAESAAKRPIWSDPKSAFHNALAEKLQEEGFHARIIAFAWSGANTVRLRDGVARDLARSIETSTEDGTLNVVIGHSHGGTIALTAAAEYLTTPIDILVATLATPFIDMFPKIDKRSDRYGAALSALHQEQLTKLRFVSLLFQSAFMLRNQAILRRELGVWNRLRRSAALQSFPQHDLRTLWRQPEQRAAALRQHGANRRRAPVGAARH